MNYRPDAYRNIRKKKSTRRKSSRKKSTKRKSSQKKTRRTKSSAKKCSQKKFSKKKCLHKKFYKKKHRPKRPRAAKGIALLSAHPRKKPPKKPSKFYESKSENSQNLESVLQ